MATIFITGSSDGIGLMAAKLLVKDGHRVILHGRNQSRSKEALAAVPGAETSVSGDLSSISETIFVAKEVNSLGPLDAIIFNAGLGDREKQRVQTVDGLSHVFAVNSLAPYILTCMINRPLRMIYTSSGLHKSGDPSLKDLNWEDRSWDGFQAYSDSKLHNVILAFAVARKWSNVLSNALDPGWVPTKMGGPGAPDSLEKAPETQIWLATSQEKEALVSGNYFFHQKLRSAHKAASDIAVQEKYLMECSRLTGIQFPTQ